VLSVPVIGGACLLEGIKLFRHTPQGVQTRVLAIGVVVSFLVGLAALVWLLRWLRGGRLHYFAWYLIPVGCAVIAWQLGR
jgi:undecaprenyl-diphosphatase